MKIAVKIDNQCFLISLFVGYIVAILEHQNYVIGNLTIGISLKLFNFQCASNTGQRCVVLPLKMVAKINSFNKEVMNWKDRLLQKNNGIHVITYLQNRYS